MTLALWIIVFFILGILVYYLDLQHGTDVYRKWYNLTHKEKLPAETIRGFVAGRKFGPRIVVVLFFVSIEVGLMILYGKLHPLEYIGLGVAEVFGMLLGFLFAPWFLKIFPGRVKNAIQYMDKIESGEVDVKKDVIKGVAKAGKEIKEITDELKEAPPSESQKQEIKQEIKAEPPKPEPKEESKEPPKEDWREGVKKYLKK